MAVGALLAVGPISK